MNSIRLGAVALTIVLIVAGNAGAITFTSTSGSLSASAAFNKVGSDLVITLTNTSGADVVNPAGVLTAVFFDLAGSPTLTRTSALMSPTSNVLFGTNPADKIVGGEWAYSETTSGQAPGGASYGISAVGLGVTGFDKFHLFPGPDLDGQIPIGGLSFGLLSAGDNPAVGNAPVTGGNPLISNSVIFTLGGLGSSFNPSTDIGNVWFQYGTSIADEPHIPGMPPGGPNPLTPIPEPLTATALVMSLAGLGAYLRRRRAA